MTDRDETTFDNNNDSSSNKHTHKPTSVSTSGNRQLLYVCLALVVLLNSLTVTAAAPERNNRYFVKDESRINRRGFKSSLLSTARGFGKRSGPVAGARQAGVSSHDGFGNNDIPTYVLAEEAVNNPQMLALLINLLDLDSNGFISPEEIVRFREPHGVAAAGQQ